MEYTRSKVKYLVIKCIIEIAVFSILLGYLPFQWKEQHNVIDNRDSYENLIEIYNKAGATDEAEITQKELETHERNIVRMRRKHLFASFLILIDIIICIILIRQIISYVDILAIMDRTNSNVCFMEKKKSILDIIKNYGK